MDITGRTNKLGRHEKTDTGQTGKNKQVGYRHEKADTKGRQGITDKKGGHVRTNKLGRHEKTDTG